jgi:hypothetical protein
MRILFSLALLAAGFLLAPGVADAHHSFAMFDMSKSVVKKAVVKNVEWANPHVWINVIITNDQGLPEEWGLETTSTHMLGRRGWKRDSLKPGDKIDAAFFPMRNGTHAGSMRSITTADGTVLNGSEPGGRAP